MSIKTTISPFPTTYYCKQYKSTSLSPTIKIDSSGNVSVTKQLKSLFKHVTLLDPQYSLNIVIVLLLSLVSFYTSYDGLRHYMFGQTPQDASWGLLILLGFLVFLIQLLLIVALSRLTQRISLSNKVSMIFLYFIAMGFSVFLSYSYWYQAIQADNYAYNNFNTQLDDSLSDVGIYQDTFLNIKKIAEELAEYSQETALLEKNRGRTCGDNSSPGAGPRLSLRNSEEQLFTLMNNDISILNDQITHKINKLDSIRYGYSPESDIKKLQKEMNIVIASVNRYKQTPALVKAKRALKEHSGEARNTLSVLHNETERPVSCPDTIITQKSQLLLERINELPALKNIRLFDVQNDREVMERALKVFLVIPSTVKGFVTPSTETVEDIEKKKSAEAVKSSDFTPLILGVMIDLVIFFVGYSNGKYTQQRNYLSGNYHGQHFSVNDAIKINHVFNIKELRENLQWYHHQLGKKHLIIIPSDTYRQAEDSNKRNLVSLMESLLANRRVSLQALRVPFTTLPKNMRRRFADLAEDTLFEFYHTTEEQWFDLLQSLEADEILTSKKSTTSDFVISTLEHHQVKPSHAVENTESTLSLRKNIAHEKQENTEITSETQDKATTPLTTQEKEEADKKLSKEEKWEQSIAKQQAEEDLAKQKRVKDAKLKADKTQHETTTEAIKKDKKPTENATKQEASTKENSNKDAVKQETESKTEVTQEASAKPRPATIPPPLPPQKKEGNST